MDIRHAVGVKRGVAVEKLADILTYRESPRYSERERVALEFCEQITRDDLDVSRECLARLREHFTDAEVVELTFIIGYQTFASKFAKAMRLLPQGFSSRSLVDGDVGHAAGGEGLTVPAAPALSQTETGQARHQI